MYIAYVCLELSTSTPQDFQQTHTYTELLIHVKH